MEQRLFIVACIMYVFAYITRKLNKKYPLVSSPWFAGWHAFYLLLILHCALYLFLFVTGGGAGESLNWTKFIIGSLLIDSYAIYGFIKAKKAAQNKKEEMIADDLDWSNTVYFAGFVASVVMFFLIQAFKIPSASMQDTLLEGDHLFVNKAVYGFRLPFTKKWFSAYKSIQREDIIIFEFPAESKEQKNCGGSQYKRDFVKRVIGLPGDKIEIKDAQVYINDELYPRKPYEKYEPVPRLQKTMEVFVPVDYQKLWEEHKLDSYMGMILRDQFGPVVVPENSYFALGDNRDNSCDSRFWGPVPRQNIKGKAWFIHWPLKRIRLIK